MQAQVEAARRAAKQNALSASLNSVDKDVALTEVVRSKVERHSVEAAALTKQQIGDLLAEQEELAKKR